MAIGWRHLLVLGWHNVEGTPCFPSEPGAGLAGFRAQLDWLARWASVVPLGAALERLRGGGGLPRRAVAITFDDGYRDNLDLAAPELSRRGMPATFFLVPGLLDRRVGPWWEVAAWAVQEATAPAPPLREVTERLKRRDQAARREALDKLVAQLAPASRPPLGELFLDWEGAATLARGGFEIGSHSRDHAILSEETAEAQARDLRESREILADRLGVPVRGIAYPNGTRRDYDAATVAAADAAGYEYGVTTRKGFATAGGRPFEVRRVVVQPERGVDVLRTAVDVARRRARRLLARAGIAPAARYHQASS